MCFLSIHPAAYSFDFVINSMISGIAGVQVDIGVHVQGFDCKELLYTDYKQLPASLEKSLNCRYVPEVSDLVSQCDVVTINCPLHKVCARTAFPVWYI